MGEGERVRVESRAGALEIDIFTEVPRELVVVMQALIILFVVSIGELAALRRRRRGQGAS